MVLELLNVRPFTVIVRVRVRVLQKVELVTILKTKLFKFCPF